MLSSNYSNSNYLTGFYHFLSEKDEIQDLSSKIERLNLREVGNPPNLNNYIVAPYYSGELVILKLTELCGLSVGLLYFLNKNDIALVNFRFHSELYKKDTHLYGELRMKSGITYLEIFAVRMGIEEKLSVLLEEFDQILYTKFIEDFDMEPIRIVFKPFYNNPNELLDTKRGIYLNANLNGQHYITLGTA